MTLPRTFKQAVFKEAGGPLSIEYAELHLPNKGEVLVKVEACGVCYSDHFAQDNVMGGGLYVPPLRLSFVATSSANGYVSLAKAIPQVSIFVNAPSI